MRYGTNSRGYTILEVMIFLAISGFMFVVAASFINGKQARAEFNQGMNSINTQIRDTINAVANGYYPATNNFSCSALSSGFPDPNGPPGATTEQGNNQGCVFMGKFMQFGDPINVTNGEDTFYNTFSVAGRQFAPQPPAVNATTLPSTFAEAKPVIVKKITENKKFENGIVLTKIVSNGVTPLAGIGFFNSFSSYNASSGNLESGAQSVTLVTLPATGVGRNQTLPDMSLQINNLTDTDVQTNPNILICFTGDAGQFGALTIGSSNGQRLATKIQISASLPAGC